MCAKQKPTPEVAFQGPVKLPEEGAWAARTKGHPLREIDRWLFSFLIFYRHFHGIIKPMTITEAQAVKFSSAVKSLLTDGRLYTGLKD